jgi:hypothetical protein
MDAHVFVDNSNIFGGARRAAETLEPEAVWLAVRMYYKNFFRLVEHGFNVRTRVMAGSVPPGNDELWEYSREAGYDTDLLHRVAKDDKGLVEQGVDELLHLKIANALLDYDPPQALVLCTGDAHDADYGTSFRMQVIRALKRNWDVHVWSWKDQLSGKFEKLKDRAGTKITVHLLDPYYKRVTFVREGEYEIYGARVAIKGRVVHKLEV